MSRKELIKHLSALVKVEKIKLERLEKAINKQKLDIKNSKLFINLSKASKQKRKIEALKLQINQLKISLKKKIQVGVSSRVYLLSSKFNKQLLVDAKNYVELVGKNIGDAVTMNNSTFLVAGVF